MSAGRAHSGTKSMRAIIVSPWALAWSTTRSAWLPVVVAPCSARSSPRESTRPPTGCPSRAPSASVRWIFHSSTSSVRRVCTPILGLSVSTVLRRADRHQALGGALSSAKTRQKQAATRDPRSREPCLRVQTVSVARLLSSLSSLCYTRPRAPVAQRIEQRFPKPCVGGSTPSWGTSAQVRPRRPSAPVPIHYSPIQLLQSAALLLRTPRSPADSSTAPLHRPLPGAPVSRNWLALATCRRRMLKATA